MGQALGRVNLCLKLSYSAGMSARTSVVRTNGASPVQYEVPGADTRAIPGGGPLLFLPKRDRAAVVNGTGGGGVAI